MSRGAEGLEQAVDETLIRDLAKKVLRQTAPEELPLLRPASERYFADPEKALRTRRQEQEVLGFGTEAAIALLTPVVLTIVTDILKSFASDLARHAGSHGVDDSTDQPAPAFPVGPCWHSGGTTRRFRPSLPTSWQWFAAAPSTGRWSSISRSRRQTCWPMRSSAIS